MVGKATFETEMSGYQDRIVFFSFLWVKQCHKPPMTGNGKFIPPIYPHLRDFLPKKLAPAGSIATSWLSLQAPQLVASGHWRLNGGCCLAKAIGNWGWLANHKHGDELGMVNEIA
jgi:hypothetical protein